MILITNKNTTIIENSKKRINSYIIDNQSHFINLTILDVCIKQNESHLIQFKKEQSNIFLPLLGSFIIDDQTVNPNEIYLFSKDSKERIKATEEEYSYGLLFTFDHYISKNYTLPINIGNNGFVKKKVENLSIDLGMYSLRTKDIYSLNSNPAVIYTISGAFELNECLLEARDVLIIENTKEVDFEALSNNALLLMIQINNNI